MRFAAHRARNLLITIFVGALALQLSLIGYSCLAEKIYAEDMQALAVSVLTAYSVPLGIICTGIFSKPGQSLPASRVAGLTALSLSAMWNLLFVARVAMFAFASVDDVDGLQGWFTTLTAASSFLVASALTFYFVSDPPAREGRGAALQERNAA